MLFDSLGAPCLVWSGVVLAVAIEAPTKFKAKSVTRKIGLDVGRVVFPAISNAEAGLSVGAGLICLRQAMVLKSGSPGWQGLVVASLALAVQKLVLMPKLLDRAALIIDEDKEPPKSPVHKFYAVAEITKFVALLVAAGLAY